MASSKFYLDLRGKAKDKKGSIIIHVSNNKTVASVSTGVRIEKKYWNGNSIVKHPDAIILNAELARKKSKVDAVIARLSLADLLDTMTATDIKHEIETEKKVVVKRTLVSDIFEEYIQNGMSEGTEEIYRTTLSKVIAYGGEKMKLDNITLKWLYDFDKWMSSTLCTNSRSIYMRSLKAICRYAYKTKIVNANPFDDFKIKNEETRKRCKTVEILREFRDYPTSERNSMFRDYFFLMFYLIGINAVDLFNAIDDNVVDGRLNYIRRKTHKKYSIKIEPEAQEIINRYKGKNYLVDAKDRCLHYKSFLRMMNDSIRTIGPTVTSEKDDELFGSVEESKIMPIADDLTTQWARHSWATIAASIDIPTDVISLALGHSNVNKTTLIYIKPDMSKVDKANRKVIDYLKGFS